MASSVTRAPPRAQGGGRMGREIVELAHGVKVRSPSSVLPARSSDPLRPRRQFLGNDSSGWMGVDVTPCMAQRGESMNLLLTMRDPGYRADRVERVDER